jgi:hypothetical protein
MSVNPDSPAVGQSAERKVSFADRLRMYRYDNLRDIGLTSLDMTNLVLSVEGELSVRVPDGATTPANFTCVTAIAGLVVKSLNAETDLPSLTGC